MARAPAQVKAGWGFVGDGGAGKPELEDCANGGNYSVSNVTTGHASFYKYLDLKAEIEKLKAAQRSHGNIDPERYRLCRQEITSLRMQLHQRERDMAEMQRWVVSEVPRWWENCRGGFRALSLLSPYGNASATSRPSHSFPSGFVIFMDCLLILNYVYISVYMCLYL